MELGYLLILIISFVISVLLIPIVKRISSKVGLVDMPNERKIHTKPVPYGGGIAIFLSVAITIFLGFIAGVWFASLPRPSWISLELYKHLPNLFKTPLREVIAIMLGGAVMFLLGFLDDKYNLKPIIKFAVQIAVAIALVLVGINATIYIPSKIIAGIITVIWIVGITNSFNLLDNMDGLSAGVAFIVASIFLVVALQTGQMFLAAILMTVMGSLGGFLIFNFPPASIFMGDSGSYFVGYMLAVLTILFTFKFELTPLTVQSNFLIPIVLPLLIFLVPIYDTLSVIFLRLKAGHSPFKADKRHFSHRLVNLGMSQREAVLTIYIVTFALGVSAINLYFLNFAGALITLLQSFGVIIILILLERAGRRKSKYGNSQ